MPTPETNAAEFDGPADGGQVLAVREADCTGPADLARIAADREAGQ